MTNKIYTTVLATLAATAIGSAYAAVHTENDALAIANAKIGLIQAVTVAEQHIGGKAARAEYEQEKGHWVFDVEVVKDNKVMDVKIDPASGNVIAATEDVADHDDEHDKAD